MGKVTRKPKRAQTDTVPAVEQGETQAMLDGWLAQRAVAPSPGLQAKRARLLKILAKV